MGASLNRGESAQDVETPDEFMEAVKARFGTPFIDLAATAENTKAPYWFGLGGYAEDSLAVRWPVYSLEIAVGGKGVGEVTSHPLLWLNPPFDPIEPWVAKCAEEYQRGARILLLCRGSIDSNWWWNYIMTAEKVIQVCRLYQDRLKYQKLITDLDDPLVHVLEMLPKLIQFCEAGRIEKAFRWLGFVQGVLWCEGIYTIDEMRRHNMPDAEVK